MLLISFDSAKCFECDSISNIVNHHVIPQSLGGKNTIPLCQPCHDKVHGVKPRNISLSNLTKQGLQKAKQRGVKLGSPNPEKSIKSMNDGATKAKKEFRIKMSPITTYLKNNGFKTLQSKADYLNNKNIPTRTGKKWVASTVHKLLNE
jgi:uncharacterized protein YlaI